MRHGMERSRYRLHDTTGDDLAPSSIPFTCKGGPARCRSAPAIAALGALQVRHEDLAAAALEVGMWPV